jgi:hypothetical protein
MRKLLAFVIFASGFPGAWSQIPDHEDVSLKLNVLLQGRYTLLQSRPGTRSQNFDIALGRIALSGDLLGANAAYFVQLESSTLGNSNRMSLLDGWVQFKPARNVSVQTGRMLLPYSRQFYTHPGNLLFSDLSEADYAFNLPRSLGVTTSAQFGRLAVLGSVVNSVRALDASGQRNAQPQVAGIARLELDLLQPYGYIESVTSAFSKPQLSVGVAVASNRVSDASAFQNLTPGDRTANYTLDGGYRWRRLSAQAALYGRRTAHALLTGSRRDTDYGAYAQTGFYVVPGAWEIAARHSFVDYGAERFKGVANDVREYTLGVNRYLRGHALKLQTDVSALRHHSFAGANGIDYRLRAQAQLLF